MLNVEETPRMSPGAKPFFPTETDLISAALALGAPDVTPWSEAETALARLATGTKPLTKGKLSSLRDSIHAGHDPLGEAFCTLRSPSERREHGATYTPGPIVRSMVEWAADRGTPERIIDPGTGSARFLLRAGETFPNAALIGIDIAPLAALISAFRKERLEEPPGDYLEAFDLYQGYFEEFLKTTADLAQLDGQALEVLTDPRLLEALGYLAAPPISEDDLQVLAEAPTLAKGQLRKNPDPPRIPANG